MYATPATGSSQNPNDLEDYLLGKKRVDKMLIADENSKVRVLLGFIHTEVSHYLKLAASHKSFIAVQNANTSRDIAAKIREDPLLAIKQQEQSAYQALLSNPLRLAKMQRDLGVKPAKDKKDKKREKEERKRLKRERKHRRERELLSPSPSAMRKDGERSPLPERYRHSSRSRGLHYSSSRSRSGSLSPVPRQYDDVTSRRSRCYSPDSYRGRNRSRSPIDSEKPYRRPRSESSHYNDRRRYEQPYRQRSPDHGKRSRSPRFRSPVHKRVRVDRSPLRPHSSVIADDAKARNARLAAMSSNAIAMSADRQQRLAALLEKEKAELEANKQAMAKSKGMPGFLSQEQKRVFGGVGGLEDRIRRGRGGMVVDAD